MPRGRPFWPFCVIALLLSSTAWGAGEDDFVDVLYISRWSTFRNRFDKMMEADPSVRVLGVPMPGTFSIGRGYIDADDLNRRMRIYMPRSLNQLAQERDVVVMHDAPLGHHEVTVVHFDLKWVAWFVEAVRTRGVSFSMWGGDASWGGGGEGDYPSWGDTMLDEILPLKCHSGYNMYALHRREFRDPAHPLSRIPWERAPLIEHVNVVDLKLGAVPIADAVSKDARRPWIACWDIGDAKVVGETEIFGSAGTSHLHDIMRRHWAWYQDYLVYLVYFATNKPIPTDVIRTHRLRQEMNLHIAKNSLMLSLLDFVANFGANTPDLYAELDAINTKKRDAEDFYRQGEYDSVSAIFDELETRWLQLNNRAAEAKQKALAWVYLIEWLSVTGTGLVAGVLLWALITRRMLYKEVSITRTRTGRV